MFSILLAPFLGLFVTVTLVTLFARLLPSVIPVPLSFPLATLAPLAPVVVMLLLSIFPKA